MGPIGLDGPHTYPQYLEALGKTPLPMNVSAMIGHRNRQGSASRAFLTPPTPSRSWMPPGPD